MKKIISLAKQKKIYLFLFLCFSLLILQQNLFAQEQEINFVDTFRIENNKAATFGIVGDFQQINRESIITKVSMLSGIISFRFFYDRRCLIIYNSSLNISELRTIFISENIDFDLNTISTLNLSIADELKYKKAAFPKYIPSVNPIDPANWVYPASFPLYINTGNPEFDNLKLEKAKAIWCRLYPEESKIMTGDEYIDDMNYIFLKKQYNKNSY